MKLMSECPVRKGRALSVSPKRLGDPAYLPFGIQHRLMWELPTQAMRGSCIEQATRQRGRFDETDEGTIA